MKKLRIRTEILAGYYVWMNARNDLVAGQVDGLIEEHVYNQL